MSLLDHAKREFDILGWPGDDEMQELMCKQVLELLAVFAEHGHSGSSAPYAISLFEKLARLHAISPLTGEDSEWGEPFDYAGTCQNNRDSAVFRRADGTAYWIDGRVFYDFGSGSGYTNGNSCVPVTFPWTRPKPQAVQVRWWNKWRWK